MNGGRALEVQSNSLHGAIEMSRASIADAYQFNVLFTGAACDCWDNFATQILPLTHTIRHHVKYVSPFQASLNALDLQWEVCNDLGHYPSTPERSCSISSSILCPVKSSQRPLPRHVVQKHVRFEDHIDVFIGEDEALEMGHLHVSQSAICNWNTKPWSKKRIRPKTISNQCADQFISIATQEPLPKVLALSRVVSSDVLIEDEPTIFMQLNFPAPMTCKQSPYDEGEAGLMNAFHQGHTQPAHEDQSPNENAEATDSDSSSAEDPAVEGTGTSQNTPQYRQEVVLYHLTDQAIRTFLNWSGYEEMMTEIAHHYGADRERLIDAYEVVSPLPDLDANIVPIVVHFHDDYPPFHLSKLVLLDLEVHGNRVEDHFQVGPTITRSVIVVPARVSRQGLLRAAEVDRYCSSENGRCLVFINTKRWPDYDLATKAISHADHARVVIPPSDGFACPTDDMIQMRQAGMTDDEIVDIIYNEDVISGYSPSPLGEEEVHALATPNIVDDADHLFAMQTSCQAHTEKQQVGQDVSHGHQHGLANIDSDSSASLPEDWMIDLQRLVDRHRLNCQADEEAEFLFSVYTWYLDHGSQILCRNPKIAVLGGDPSEWREDLISPWEHHVRIEDSILIDLVSPFQPRPGIEEHIAHVILTQRPERSSSVLFSMEFLGHDEPSVISRVAAVVPPICTQTDLERIVPLFAAFAQNPIVWDHPTLTLEHETFRTRHGLGLKVTIKPEDVLSSDDHHDHHSLLQSAPYVFECRSTLVNLDDVTDPEKPCASFTDEFLQAVEAANNAQDEPPPPIDPLSIDAQPQAFQRLWARIVEQMESNIAQMQERVRVESWYLNHVTLHRCHSPRITLLNTDFTRWREQLAATWSDRVMDLNDLQFAVVDPVPEDCATGITVQFIITEKALPEQRSTVISVYDSEEDAERNPYTFAIVLRQRINLQRLIEALHLQTSCPPMNIRNHCSLWFGSIPISTHEVNVQAGNAFRLIVSRGIFLDVPQLLVMDNHKLRRVLQRAIHSEIYDRPPDPDFVVQGILEHASGSASSHNEVLADARPPWIPILERHFQAGSSRISLDEHPTMEVVTWYLNHVDDYHCGRPRTTRITNESFMWRTDCIFVWRDRLVRGSPADLVALPQLLPSTNSDILSPHVIVTQGLPTDSHAVLLMVQGTDGLSLPRQQFAHLFPGRVTGRDILRLVVPDAHAHRPVAIQMDGQTYFPDDTLIIQTGAMILVLISRLDIDIHMDPIADGFSLMQTDAARSSLPRVCKPAEFGTPDDRPLFTMNDRAQRPPRPYHDGASDWTLDLGHIALAAGEYNVWDDETTFPVATWYVHHSRRPTCHQPRIVRLSGNPITWIEDLRTVWQDSMDPRIPFAIFVVKPHPPQFRARRMACHIILEQAPQDNKAAVLLTALLEGHTGDGIIQGAYSFDRRFNAATLMRMMDLVHVCAGRQCSLFLNSQIVSAVDWNDAFSGNSIYIRATPPARSVEESAIDQDVHQHFEDLALMQTTSARMNPDAPVFQPNQPYITAQPEHLQDLFACWENHAFAWEDESRAMHILTWFVAPGRGVLRCQSSRRVTLFEDFLQWEKKIKEKWAPLLEPDIPTSFVVVQPAPPLMEPSISAHVIVVQHEVTTWSSPLVTIYDSAVNNGFPFRVVPTISDRATLNDILSAIDYAADCQTVGTTCNLWIDRVPIPPGTHVLLCTAHCLVLQVNRLVLPANWCPPIDPVPMEEAGLGLLQVKARVLHPVETSPTADNPQSVEETEYLRLDLHPAIVAFEWVDSHLFLPSYIVPDGVNLLPESRAWADLPIWNIGGHCDSIAIYFDGAFHPQSRDAGFAVAAFIQSGSQWFQAGMISGRIVASESYTPESFAGLVALKFAFDLVKQVLIGQIKLCTVWFGYDSLTVGQQIKGDWNSFRTPLAVSVMRSLHRLLQGRFGIIPSFQHIPSHRGEPGNELVDALAAAAAKEGGTHDITPFVCSVLERSFVKALEWTWMLFEPSYRHLWVEHCIRIPKHPDTQPDPMIFPEEAFTVPLPDPNAVSAAQATFCFKISSCNVLTLKGAESKQLGLDGVARQDTVLEQFHELQVNILALQETRLRKLHRTNDPRYVLVKSAANCNGCYGILVGLSKKIPHGWQVDPLTKNKRPVYFHDAHVAIIAAEPRILIVRLKTPVLRCILIAIHALHTGHADTEVQEWWGYVGSLIPAKYNDWPRLLLCDANARVGSVATKQIGNHQAETETSKSEFFRSFLSDQGLWLPSTFEQFQTGPGGTWLHPNGQWLRGDYIGLPVHWNFTHCQASVSDEIDVSTIKEDHRAVLVQIEGPCSEYRWTGKKRICRITDEHVQNLPTEAFNNVQRPGFTVDVHTHATLLQEQLLGQFGSRKANRQQKPRKEGMSSSTWQLVQTKRNWRNHLHDAKALQRKMLLQLCLQSFQNHGTTHDNEAVNRIMHQQDVLIAQALMHFRRLGRQVVKALRFDDVQFFQALASEAGAFVQPKQAKDLWRTIRRSFPKFQQRRLNAPPEQIEVLEDKWHPYFQHLEAGTYVEIEDLIKECHDFQTEQGSVQDLCHIHEIPSLHLIENTFRSTQPGKSTGFDPIASGLFHSYPVETARMFFDLILKIYMWQAEPLAYKGGVMAVIPKRIGASQVNHFRGIMLLPTVAKRIHALLRSTTVQLIERIKPQGQIGGFMNQQVGYASQALRTFCRIAHHHGFSTGVLFVDLANAFHRLVRELVCGQSMQKDVQAVLETIEQDHGTNRGLRAWLAIPGMLERLGASPILIQLMREVHTNTWHTLAGMPGVTRTRRGTRPGSPLADVVFHVLMMDIVIEINTWIEAQQPYQQALRHMDVQIDSLVWSDDLAIPWCTQQAAELVPAMQALLMVVDRTFKRRGFDLNMDQGKTGAVLTFQGTGAPEMRRTYLLSEPSGFWCKLDQDESKWLHVSATYRHLGTQFASRLDFTEEMKFRIGQAASAFSAMRRQVFCNRHLPVQIRLKLFQALVCTRLYFGLGAWMTPPTAQLHQMRKALAHYLYCILCAGKKHTEKRPTDGQIFAEANFLEPRIRLAQDRLLFAHKIFQHGPAFAQHLLHVEFQTLPHSWISGLFADLAWLRSTLPDSIPAEWTTSLTEAIDFWQKGAPGWQATIRRAGRQHLLQEGMMQEVYYWHRRFFRELDKHAATFDPPYFGRALGEGSFPCHCGRHFDTAQGLSTHRRKAHGIFSLEHDLIAGATCPVCLVHFWTTQRLQQHLSYISRKTGRNACYQTLRKSGYTTAYEKVSVPRRLHGTNRIEAVRSAGPHTHFAPVLETQIHDWQHEIDQLEAQLTNICKPPNVQEAEIALRQGLTEATQRWFKSFCDASFDLSIVGPLQDFWYDYLVQWPDEFDEWYSDGLLTWGQRDLPDVVAEFVDGEAEKYADEAYYEVSRDMPRSQWRDRMAFLSRCVRQAQDDLKQDVKHRPVRKSEQDGDTRHARSDPDALHTHFQSQTAWHEEVRKLRWQCLPSEVATPAIQDLFVRPVFLIVHLFSGRRREFDVHWYLAQMAQARGLDVAILSMDTAVSSHYGDLTANSVSWQRLEYLYEHGLVAATICGSPCETFSAARHVPPPEHLPEEVRSRWPRPIRSFARLFGLPGLRPKELRQCRQGTAFMLQATMACIWHLTRGGLFLSEHPAPPHDTSKASIWTSAILQLLLQHPDIHLRVFNQWQWGAPVKKPTGLMSLRLPRLTASMYACADPEAVPPKDVAIGMDWNGHFKTAVCKEYPKKFSQGLAKAVIDQLCTEWRQGIGQFSLLSIHDLQTTTWLHDALLECTTIYSNSTHMPDYQGR